MTPDEKRAFVRDNHRAVLVTRRADGRVQTSPVVCGLADDGRVAVSITEDRAKTKNLRRDNRAAICVFTDDFFGPWVQVDGPVELVPAPTGTEGLKALYRQVAGEHPDWDEYEAAMVRDRRVLCLISIDD